MKVAIIGGTGKLGLPVAAQLQADGIAVTIITHNLAAARSKLGNRFRYIEGDVTDPTSIEQAVNGFDAVHINLSGFNRKECMETIYQGTINIVNACQQAGVSLISFISGCTVNESNTHFYDIEAKYKAEQAIINSDLPYLIFCPSWFMETLPQFVQEKRVSIFGPATQPIHWLAAQDYACMVSQAYKNPSIRDHRFVLHGPEALTLGEALSTYLATQQRQLDIGHAPYWLGSVLTWLTKDKTIKYAAELCRYYDRIGDQGDTKDTLTMLGTAKTHLADWCLKESIKPSWAEAV